MSCITALSTKRLCQVWFNGKTKTTNLRKLAITTATWMGGKDSTFLSCAIKAAHYGSGSDSIQVTYISYWRLPMMVLPINDAEPLTMHIDLNSCYAIIEQQANRLIRNKPVGVAAYDTPKGFIIASSYEAKREGIKLMRVQEAREIDEDIIVMMPDPEKYFDAHKRFKKVLQRFTSEVTPKSIDEFVVDFAGSPAVREGRRLTDVGLEIKQAIRESLGEYVTVNIGIATNRFLAKVAAGLDKPDGMNVIHGEEIHNIYGQLDLMDLPGINYRYQERLNLDGGIFTPLDFLAAKSDLLYRQVFRSIVGSQWYMRLRGHEVDARNFAIKSFGNDYAVGAKTFDRNEVAKMLMKLCEKTGRRLRKHSLQGTGVALWLSFTNHTWWGKSRRSKNTIYTTQEIYFHIMELFNLVRFPDKVAHVHLAVIGAIPATPVQTSLFDNTRLDNRKLSKAIDILNDRYGEFTVIPAMLAGMENIIIKRVPFGSVRDI